jgi:hypothetical protein
VELLTMFLLKSSWETNMTRWLMFGVLEFYAMNYVQDMLPFNHQRVDNKPIERFLMSILNSRNIYRNKFKASLENY